MTNLSPSVQGARWLTTSGEPCREWHEACQTKQVTLRIVYSANETRNGCLKSLTREKACQRLSFTQRPQITLSMSLTDKLQVPQLVAGPITGYLSAVGGIWTGLGLDWPWTGSCYSPSHKQPEMLVPHQGCSCQQRNHLLEGRLGCCLISDLRWSRRPSFGSSVCVTVNS
jgi:hypothetical protein